MGNAGFELAEGNPCPNGERFASELPLFVFPLFPALPPKTDVVDASCAKGEVFRFTPLFVSPLPPTVPPHVGIANGCVDGEDALGVGVAGIPKTGWVNRLDGLLKKLSVFEALVWSVIPKPEAALDEGGKEAGVVPGAENSVPR